MIRTLSIYTSGPLLLEKQALVNMSYPDVKDAHRRHSPADNIELKTKHGIQKKPKKDPRNQI